MTDKNKIIVGSVLGSVGVLSAINAVRAKKFKDSNKAVNEIETKENVYEERFIENLSKAIQYKTISNNNDELVDWDEFDRFHKFLEETYPLTFSKLMVENVSQKSLLIYWEGKNKLLDPIALLAHQDVVPVSEGTEKDWKYPPFAGEVAEGFIWGRGSLDMKNHLICVLESVETLLSENYVPERGIYICLGHNEEIVRETDNGALAMARLLKERGVHLDSIIDEGGARLPIKVPGIIDINLAGVGVAEKGYADVKITVFSKGGHSSQAPVHSGLGELANVIKDLENHQFKSEISPVMQHILDKLIKNTTFPVRYVGCNLKFIKPIVRKALEQITSMASMIRTTTAVTQAYGSPQANVLPQESSIIVNFRIMPGQTIDDVVKHIRKVVRNKNIEIEVLGYKCPSKWSPYDTRAFNVIEDISKAMCQKNVTMPYLVMGGTDACRYENVCENIYRYSPFLVSIEDLKHTHGTNEKIPVESLKDGLTFFKLYIKKLSSD